MSYRRITQIEARAAIKERDALAKERSLRYARYSTAQYPGTHIDTVEVKNAEWHIARTARKLGHMVIVVPSDKENMLSIYAVAP